MSLEEKEEEKRRKNQAGRFRTERADKLRVHVSRSMSDIVKTSFPILTPDVVPAQHVHNIQERVKIANIDDLKSFTKNLRQSTIENINSILEEFRGADGVFDGDDNEEND